MASETHSTKWHFASLSRSGTSSSPLYRFKPRHAWEYLLEVPDPGRPVVRASALARREHAVDTRSRFRVQVYVRLRQGRHVDRLGEHRV